MRNPACCQSAAEALLVLDLVARRATMARLDGIGKIADKLVHVQAATYGNVTENRLTPGSTVSQVGGPPPIISSPGQPALAISTIASNSSRKSPPCCDLPIRVSVAPVPEALPNLAGAGCWRRNADRRRRWSRPVQGTARTLTGGVTGGRTSLVRAGASRTGSSRTPYFPSRRRES